MSKGFSITEIDNIVISEKDTVLSFNNEDFKVSQEQPIFIKRDGIYGVISAGLVDESDYLIKINNSGEIEEVKVNFIQTYSGNFNVYSISLNENSWYVAGDYLVHTK
jgi:hypothetical protein